MYDIKTENRFWSKVETGGEDECWEWKGGLITTGYGRMSIKSVPTLAHRYSYELYHNRLIKDGMILLHSCDNPKCVNPNHLREGTYKENTADMMNKGRGSVGEKQGASKLTEAQVKEIRMKYANNKITQRELAQQYGISQSTIYNIIANKIWKHLPP